MSMSQKVNQLLFGTAQIPNSQVFVLRKNVFGIVNNKPFVPGHVLLVSRRVVPKMQDLTEIQALDMFMTAQEVAKKLESIYKTDINLVVQNGADAGQTMKHVHIHILPHSVGVESTEKKGQIRSEQDMAQEASTYRPLFQQSFQ